MSDPQTTDGATEQAVATGRQRRGRTSRSGPPAFRTVLVAAVVAALVGATTATAATKFTDVPSTNPFAKDIEFLARTGVVQGNPDGTFNPGGLITRQAAAAWIRRAWDVQESTSVAYSNDSTTVTSTDWVDLPSSSMTLLKPIGVHARVQTLFSAESYCTGTPAGYCMVRVLIGGVEAVPYSESAAFDSSDDGDEGGYSWESHAIQRFGGMGKDATETTVTVQARVSDPGVTFSIDDWTASAETDLLPSSFVPIG